VDVLDARYKGFRFTHTDVIADKASAGVFYLGPIARRPDELELHPIGCIVRVNGEVTMTVAGAAVMGHPAAAAERGWPAGQLAAESQTLKAGQLIFSGGVIAPVPVVPDENVTFEFDGLGAIEVSGG
jgi:2-oxo-3-hexenedioate decarboxylase